jgi:hypothetical protein
MEMSKYNANGSSYLLTVPKDTVINNFPGSQLLGTLPGRTCYFKERAVVTYPAEVEQKMKQFADWLSEKDRRRYAAVEALKLGHGGVDYIARLLGCDPKTIRQGLQDLDQPEDLAADRVRKKGVDAGP